ncbi:large ribosomal subunit protein cL38-like [Bidens hawaiensis]|uniref:large ribosomal subunit protein cL38-like n=1 Tax=Bidens hawaiensis TaxID=980011 RepID=UPI00404AE9AF
MSVSAIFGVRLATISPDRQSPYAGSTRIAPPSVRYSDGTGTGTGIGGLTIECSSRPQKKATAHHRKSRPKKTQPWDKNRGPTVYPPLPDLPPEWSFVDQEGVKETSSASPGS